ncbi:hypothetical protein [Heyndrickxia sporothermodurans]|uniref:hypothetical protein n=1 Tax=Heyndrickxia sporothermodurans TaxID=46224 RepID=UPI0035E1FFA7
MKKMLLHNIVSQKYIVKVDKYIVELAVYDNPKQTVWLTDRQMDNLIYCFDMTRNGYSNKQALVYGHWNENGYYAYTSVEKREKRKEFKLPYQYDLSDIEEVD